MGRKLPATLSSILLDMQSPSIGFVGAGQMARALAAGFVRAGLVQPAAVAAADPVPAALEAFEKSVPGARTSSDNVDVAQASEVVVLATKPQQIGAAVLSLRNATKDKLVISIAAGITLKSLDSTLAHARLVRVMPNTPCLVAQSASGYCLGQRATRDDGELVARLLGSVGVAIEVEEPLLDAVTGLSGSGPAFAYVMIEALADGGVRMGLKRDVALKLAAQTLRGAAQMVLETGEHPAVLKDRVASPGGTTIAGLEALEAGGLRGTLMAAVEAATRRSIELGRV
jgi:pyrroline-5-carboxylate reductase